MGASVFAMFGVFGSPWEGLESPKISPKMQYERMLEVCSHHIPQKILQAIVGPFLHQINRVVYH